MVQPIVIDVVSDVVCPWCFVGKKRLEEALAALPDLSAEVRWRPFQLDPTIPAQGLERQAYMLAKFGDPERLRSAHERLDQLGREVGIDFAFDAIKVSPNTLDAHRVVRWAADGGNQGAVVQQLFSRYFEQGQNVGDHAVLAEAAGAAGMDATLVTTMLATDADKAEVEAEIQMAGQMGVTGVPCFIIAGKYAVMGAQTAQVLAEAISRAAAEVA